MAALLKREQMAVHVDGSANYTDVDSKWVLVYCGSCGVCKVKHVNQMTISEKTIEEFDTEEDLDARVTSLELDCPEDFGCGNQPGHMKSILVDRERNTAND